MSTSLVAVFIPILLMGGIVGRLFREFAVTLEHGHRGFAGGFADHHADDVRQFLQRRGREQARPRSIASASGSSTGCLHSLQPLAALGLAPSALTLVVMLATVASASPVHHRAQGLLPAAGHRAADGQHPGGAGYFLSGAAAEACSSSATSCSQIPAVDTVVAFTGGGGAETRHAVHQLKPLAQRKVSADQVIGRLRRKLAVIPGATLFSRPAGCAGRRAHEQRAVPVHAAGRRTSSELNALGAAPAATLRDHAGAARRFQRSAEQGPGSCTWPSTATPPRAGRPRRSRSTTRSTTPSASARSPPCTGSSTSTTW